MDPAPRRKRFAWRTLFEPSPLPVFVVSAARRLRLTNPAFDRLVGRAGLGGTRVSRLKSATALGQALAPPEEVWAGAAATVRRALPGRELGPPWWDVAFWPVPGPRGAVWVVGSVTVVGTATSGETPAVPEAFGELKARHARHFGWGRWHAPSAASVRLLAQAQLAARTDAPVWVHGGPGVGKGTLARTIHHQGDRRERAFVLLDGVGVQPYLLEAQLFGKAGLAATELVGTVCVLDPAGLPLPLQGKIAAWATRPGGPRLVSVAATTATAEAGKLVPWFLTHGAVLELAVPPLHARPGDLPFLAGQVLGDAAGRLEPAAWVALAAYPWPGNVRELTEVLTQAAAKADGGPVTLRHLPRPLQERHLLAANPLPHRAGPGLSLDAVLEAVERRMLEYALRQANGSQTEAAKALGIYRTRLGRRLEALGIAATGGTP